jgi:site-specific recombinase XerD
MEKAVAAYIADLEARRFSLSRRSHSEYTLSLVAAWLNEAHAVTDWREVTESHLRGFLIYAERDHRSPQGKPISAGTRKQWLTVIRGFFAWQRRRGRIIHDPAEPVTLPKADRRLPHVLNEEEIARLIETPDTSTILGLRDRALMEVLYATGMRHGEACRLNVYDVDLRARRVIIREGKGAKDRVTPLTKNACHWLRRYLSESRPEIAAGKLWGKVAAPQAARDSLVAGAVAVGDGPQILLPDDRSDHPRIRRRVRIESHAAHVQTLLRHASAEARGEHPLHPATARPRQAGNDRTLHPPDDRRPQSRHHRRSRNHRRKDRQGLSRSGILRRVGCIFLLAARTAVSGRSIFDRKKADGRLLLSGELLVSRS